MKRVREKEKLLIDAQKTGNQLIYQLTYVQVTTLRKPPFLRSSDSPKYHHKDCKSTLKFVYNYLPRVNLLEQITVTTNDCWKWRLTFFYNL